MSYLCQLIKPRWRTICYQNYFFHKCINASMLKDKSGSNVLTHCCRHRDRLCNSALGAVLVPRKSAWGSRSLCCDSAPWRQSAASSGSATEQHFITHAADARNFVILHFHFCHVLNFNLQKVAPHNFAASSIRPLVHMSIYVFIYL